MKQLIKKFENFVAGLSKRDQISFAIICAVAVVMLWFSAGYAPLSEKIAATERDLVAKDTALVVLQAKMKALQQGLTTDPDEVNREQLARLIEENNRLNQALANTTTQIMNPQDMAGMLEQMLKNQPGLKFISLKNKQATPEFIEARTENVAAVENVSTIYRHSVILQVEGSYHSALSYMKKLEQFPWKFFWQDIEIETKNYPNALITIEVYTLGLREGLIGV